MIRKCLIFSVILFLGISIFFAGCTGKDYIPAHQIVLVKLTPDGSVEWSKTLEPARDQEAYNVIQTPDSGFALLANLEDPQHMHWISPHLLRLSSKGELIWDRNLHELGCGADVLLANSTSGEIITAGRGIICSFDAEGNIRCNINTGIDLTADNKGNLVNATPLNCTIANATDACQTVVSNSCYPVTITYSTDAEPAKNESLNRTSAENPVLTNASSVFISTLDGGYFTTGYTDYHPVIPSTLKYVQLTAVKLHPDGSIEWEKPLGTTGPSHVARLLQTSDGGYLIVGDIDRAFERGGKN